MSFLKGDKEKGLWFDPNSTSGPVPDKVLSSLNCLVSTMVVRAGIVKGDTL